MSLQINDYKSTISFKDLFISISFKEFIKLYSLAYLPCLLTLPAYLAFSIILLLLLLLSLQECKADNDAIV